ncbi:MAG: hypothetical protein PW734_00325 [Verrucomicrobium sp.]|nr:hypothetical protein [Verrucomicrobium sp.]
MKKGLLLLWLVLPAGFARAEGIDFSFDPNKVSPLSAKRFELKEADGFGGIAPGFEKSFALPSSDWTFRTASLGGRQIYAPAVDFSKEYRTPAVALAQTSSSLQEKTAPFSSTTVAPLPGQAPVSKFDHLFDDKFYRGREEDLIRQAIDRLSAQSDAALAKQIKPGGGNGPSLTVDQVKELINKDVAPAR